MENPDPPPSPQLFFETMNAYQRTGGLKAAIELGYTFADFRQMPTAAGFHAASPHPLLPTAESAVIASR